MNVINFFISSKCTLNNNSNKNNFYEYINAKSTTNQKERNIAEDNIIKDTKSLFRLQIYKGIKGKIIRNIRTLFESDEENSYKSVSIGNAFNSFYNEYESNGGKDKTQSIEEYLDEIRPCLSNTIKNLKAHGK